MKQFYKIVTIIIGFLFLCLPMMEAAEAAGYDYVMDPDTRRRVSIPLTYNVADVLTYEVDGKPLNQGRSLFIDRQGLLYISDTGNNRIIKSEKDGHVLDVYTGTPEKPFSQPMGLFADADGDLYVADKGNHRIVHLSPEGKVIEEFGDLNSSLLGENFVFEPTNVCVSSTGYLYTTKGHSIMTIDANNEFRGYVGSIEIGFDLKRAFVRMFATEEQQGRISRDLPPSYSNLTIAKDGTIFATSVNTSANQIIALNSVGRNTFQEGAYGETTNESGDPIVPYFVDIAVDHNGMVNALEQKTGKVYQFDREGNMTTVFGGSGNKLGQFKMASSIAVDGDGAVYILDYDRNNIQVFQPTRFIRTVQDAIHHHNEGNYAQAKGLWSDVLKIDANYSLAHKGIGKALMKEKKWAKAMEEYREADDMKDYSAAFDEYRMNVVRTKFGQILLVIAAIGMVCWFATKKSRKATRTLVDKYTKWQGGVGL